MVLSVWMRGARPVEYGLLIPGRPSWRGCDLLLTPAGALVSARGRVVDLPYEDNADGRADSWSIGRWDYGNGGDIGTGVQGTGSYGESLGGLRARRGPVAALADHVDSRTRIAPLYWARTINPRVDADRAAVQALCRALAIRPDWRRQLLAPARVTRLLGDLAGQPHRAISPKAGVRTATMETLQVMTSLGLVHRFHGRPLPDEPRPDPDEVIGKVMAALAANPYGSHPDEATVSRLVHKHYLDVTPWPFHALLADPQD